MALRVVSSRSLTLFRYCDRSHTCRCHSFEARHTLHLALPMHPPAHRSVALPVKNRLEIAALAPGSKVEGKVETARR